MTLVAIGKYFRERAKIHNRYKPDVQAWFADAATLVERHLG